MSLNTNISFIQHWKKRFNKTNQFLEFGIWILNKKNIFINSIKKFNDFYENIDLSKIIPPMIPS